MGKKKKRYTPPKDTKEDKQNIQRMKMLLLSVMACGLLTALLIAVRCPDLREICLYYCVAITVVTGLQLLEKRKTHWDLGYIVFLCVLYSILACVAILFSGLHWCFSLWAVEIAGCIVFSIARRKRMKKVTFSKRR